MRKAIPYLIIFILVFIILVEWIPRCSNGHHPLQGEPKVKNRDSIISVYKDSIVYRDSLIKRYKTIRDTIKYNPNPDSLATNKEIRGELTKAHHAVLIRDSINTEQESEISNLKTINSNQDSTNVELKAQNNWIKCENDSLKTRTRKLEKANKFWKVFGLTGWGVNLFH